MQQDTPEVLKRFPWGRCNARSRLAAAAAIIGILSAFCADTAIAQQVTGTPGSPSATTTIGGKQLPPPDPKFGGVIKQKATESKPWWAPRVVPPKGAPNVLLIMTDDAASARRARSAASSRRRRWIASPKAGLRYTNFHSTSLCSPTRAALITGRNHHSAGFGVVGEAATGFPATTRSSARKAAPSADSQGQRLCDLVVRQEPQHAVLSGEPGRAVRPMADRDGLRVFLWVRRRRHEPVAAEPLPQHDADLSRSRASRNGT